MRCAVILAGGSGTRLWPASRRARPKQFLTLGGAESLLAATVARARAVAGRITIVTAADQVELVEAAVTEVAIVGEPAARNTAAALGLAAAHAWAADPDAVLGAFPADHHIGDPVGFGVAIERAFAIAETRDVIATVGIAPTRPDTGFGYLELGDGEVAPGVRPVVRFVEKPNRATAEGYLAGGRHLWNGGMFFVRAARLLADLERLVPATGAAMRAIATALAAGDREAAAALTAARYPTLPSVSIDVGVMERTTGVVAVPGQFGWSDVGSWTTVGELAGHDPRRQRPPGRRRDPRRSRQPDRDRSRDRGGRGRGVGPGDHPGRRRGPGDAGRASPGRSGRGRGAGPGRPRPLPVTGRMPR
jgi:mannose-1-phosphate guanylyltransferase